MVTEEALVAIVDEEFPACLSRRRRRVLRYAARWLEGDDLLQEARLAVVAAFRRGGFDPSRGDPRVWAGTVARNALMDVLRTYSRESRALRVDGVVVAEAPLPACFGDTAPSEDDGPEDEVCAMEVEALAARFVDAVLAALNERQRQIVKARLGDDEPSVYEVADRFGVKPGVVKYSIGCAVAKAEKIGRRREFADLKEATT